MHYKAPTDRNQLLLDTCIEQWVSQDSEVRLIDQVIDSIIKDNEFVCSGGKNIGCKSYSPTTMLKLIFYCYYNWIPGSRRMEKETYRNVEVMWLLGGLKPDHWTICKFRRENKELIHHTAISFRKFLKENGYITGKTISFDGSKMKAYASRDMLSSKQLSSRIEKIDLQLDKFLENTEEIDILEDTLKEEAKEKQKLKKEIEDLKSEKNKLENLKSTLDDTGANYISPTDTDARLMKGRDGKFAGYNIQTGVDGEHRMIAYAQVENQQCDIDLLKDDYEQLIEQQEFVPEEVLADKGYANTEQIKDIQENSDTTCYVPIPDSARKIRDKENGIEFIYDHKNDCFICSNNKKLNLVKKGEKKNGKLRDRYQCKDCDGCPLKNKCTTSRIGRITYKPQNFQWLEEYKAWLSKTENREKVKKRKTYVEHPFGTIKMIMGKFCFILRKMPKVQVEVDIYTTVYNLKRLVNLENMQTLIMMTRKYDWKLT